MSQEYECGYCQDTGEVACSSSSYMACPECKARREKAASMTPIPPIPAYLKRWSPAARLEECGKPHGYMIGDKEGLWYFASAVDERIAKLTAEVKTAEERHVQFMVQGGPVVMAADYEKLLAENTRLKAPVSDEEWDMRHEVAKWDIRRFVNALIRSRAAIKEGQ